MTVTEVCGFPGSGPCLFPILRRHYLTGCEEVAAHLKKKKKDTKNLRQAFKVAHPLLDTNQLRYFDS